MDFIWQFSDWIEAFHIISVMFWMAGMYYLPRLFVYHAEAIEGGQEYGVFEKMEANLLRIIMNPAMIAAWTFGLLLITRPGFALGAGFWIWTKLALVVFLSGYHGFLASERQKFLAGAAPHNSRFYRMINEIPPVLTIFIVILVVVQPF
ncbi:MAG: protoporphyrinogen oxidase HemJ [Parvibaculales bacterium]